MDYHMSLAHALCWVRACHEMVEGGKIGPSISATVTYPYSNKPEDVWAAKLNDNFKTNYLLDSAQKWRISTYYMKYLEELNIVPNMPKEDKEVLKMLKWTL